MSSISPTSAHAADAVAVAVARAALAAAGMSRAGDHPLQTRPAYCISQLLLAQPTGRTVRVASLVKSGAPVANHRDWKRHEREFDQHVLPILIDAARVRGVPVAVPFRRSKGQGSAAEFGIELISVESAVARRRDSGCLDADHATTPTFAPATGDSDPTEETCPLPGAEVRAVTLQSDRDQACVEEPDRFRRRFGFAVRLEDRAAFIQFAQQQDMGDDHLRALARLNLLQRVDGRYLVKQLGWLAALGWAYISIVCAFAALTVLLLLIVRVDLVSFSQAMMFTAACGAVSALVHRTWVAPAALARKSMRGGHELQ